MITTTITTTMKDENDNPLLQERLCSVVPMLMAAFFAIAYTGVVELNLRVFSTFKKRQGLYFWSVPVATWGIAFSATGSNLDFAEVQTSIWFIATISLIGWICMVSGHSIVLYSRLHLVSYNDKQLRAMRILIITNALILHTLVGVLYLGSNSSQPGPFLHGYNVVEKIQLTLFATQEILLSGVYMRCAGHFFREADDLGGVSRRRVMKQLFFISAILIVLDLIVVCLQYANLYDVRISLKVAVYSVKLRLEFDILNQLSRVVRSRSERFTSFTSFSECEGGRSGSRHDNSARAEKVGSMSGVRLESITRQYCKVGNKPSWILEIRDTCRA